FVGQGTERLQFVFPTSTGTAEFDTRPQNRSRVFKYDSASDNGGWHDSTSYPAAEDNPLNGNMYKPLYFDGGQAIHGANNVPRSPASKGCARLRVADMDALIAWLGLDDVSGVTYDTGRINLNVNVQGAWQG
ncbi:MAG: L,D-transpeptidase, partial [Ilumatobacter fluminis]